MTIELLQLARDKLEANNIQDGLPGRETKMTEVYDFLFNRLKFKRTAEVKRAKVRDSQYSAISKHDNKTLMICGVPGTGKTVTVMQVLEQLEKLLEKKDSPIEPFRHVYINGQHLREPKRVYSEILYKLTNQSLTAEKAQEKLDELFATSSKAHEQNGDKRRRRTTRQDFLGYTVIVVDELDLLYTEKRQTIFYSLFDWPSQAEIKVIVVGIANAMDLSERFIKSGKSRCGWEKIVFEPYTSDHLRSILETRLGSDLLNKTFEKNAVVIATKRIGRTTGDARRILDTCRLAIDEAVSISESSGKFTKVNAAIIDKTGFHNYDQQRANYIRQCRPLELFVLKAIVSLMENKKFGDEMIGTVKLYQTVVFQMNKHPVFSKRLPGMDDFKAVMNVLAAIGMITMDRHNNFDLKRLSLNEDTDALKDLIRSEKLKY